MVKCILFVINLFIWESFVCLFVCHAACTLDDTILDPTRLLPSALIKALSIHLKKIINIFIFNISIIISKLSCKY